jgi:hypothetical protein
MTPEELTAFASIGTFVVIAVTAIAAIVQLRHIRAANQLAGVLEYIKIWESEPMQQANKFIRDELPAKLREPSYRRELFQSHVNRSAHPELIAADWCEQAGSYIKYGLISPPQFLDIAGAYVERVWQDLKEVVAIRRVISGPAMYENFEYLAALQLQWDERHKRGNYPRHLPRLLTDEESRVLAGPEPAKPQTT